MSRNIDALVARHVFGWRWYSQRGKGGLNPERERVFWFAPPDYKLPDHWQDVVDDEPTGKAKEYLCYPEGEPAYSTDPAAAMQVVEKMRELRFSVDIDTYTSSTEGEPWTVAFMRSTPDGKDWDASATKTAAMFPLAACLAALSALGVETKGEEHGR